MVYLFTVATIIISIVLVLVVLIQKSKGGGLSSNFSSSNQIMGAPRTADAIEKVTWYLAGALIVLSMLSTRFVRSENSQQNQLMPEMQIDNTETPDMNSPQPTTMPMPTQEAPAN